MLEQLLLERERESWQHWTDIPNPSFIIQIIYIYILYIYIYYIYYIIYIIYILPVCCGSGHQEIPRTWLSTRGLTRRGRWRSSFLESGSEAWRLIRGSVPDAWRKIPKCLRFEVIIQDGGTDPAGDAVVPSRESLFFGVFFGAALFAVIAVV